jgi:hypothetical protein
MTFIFYFVNFLVIKTILIHLLQPQLALFWNLLDPSCIPLPPPLWPSPAQSDVHDMYNDYTINNSVSDGGSLTDFSRICTDPDVYLDLNTNYNSPSFIDFNDFNTVDIARMYGSPLYPHIYSAVTNHGSALKFPAEVDTYFHEETHFGAMLGPFPDPPFPDLHCSTLMIAPKDGDKRRVIVDFPFLPTKVMQLICRHLLILTSGRPLL